MKRTTIQKGILAFRCVADLIPVAGTLMQEGLDQIEVWVEKNIPEKITDILNDAVFENLNVPAEKRAVVCAAVGDILNAMDSGIDYGFNPESATELAIQNWAKSYQYSEEDLSYIKSGFCHVRMYVLLKMMSNPEFLRQHMEDYEQFKEEFKNLVTTLEQGQATPSILEDKANEYRDNWTDELFLEDEDSGVTGVNLDTLYQDPHYYVNDPEKPKSDLKEKLESYLAAPATARTNMLVVLGHPGGGKSTLISNILMRCRCGRTIRVYRLKDLGLDWDTNTRRDPVHGLSEVLGVKNNKELLKDSVMILDGFDEISVGGDREQILNSLYRAWCAPNQISNFTLIVTCRINALPLSRDRKRWDHITLLHWDVAQIKTFAEKYWGKTGRGPESGEREAVLNKLAEMEEIMGLPLVLYMTLALKVNASGQASVTDVYDEIFNVKDGRIWNRKYGYLGAADETYKEQLYALSKKAAWNMWVNKPSEAVISEADLKKEAKLILGENREGELAELLNRFAMVRHSEGRAETEFVHRSIYEYFAAMTIFDAVRDYLQDETVISDEVTAELAGLMSVRVLSPDIQGHLERLVEKSEPTDKCKEAWRDWFGQRLENGMQSAETDVGGLTWIDQEMQCFQNYIKLLRPILGRNTENKYCKLWRDNDSDAVDFMLRYIRYAASQGNRMEYILDLSHVNLNGVDLRNANLENADLMGTDLRNADLREANLRGAVLVDANLIGADLIGADLIGAYLVGADLIGADLMGADLIGAHLMGAHLMGAVLVEANLREANLRGAVLVEANLIDANLRGASLMAARLGDTIILKSVLKDVEYDPEEMMKAILLNDDLSPAHPLTDKQKIFLGYHRISVPDN